jgi:hypothetical protein
VLPLGFAFAAAASWLSLASGHAWLFPAAALAALFALVLPLGPWRRAEGPSFSGALPCFGVLVGLLAVTQYPLDRIAPSGDFLLDAHEHVDTAFHVGVTWELATSYPPQVPGFAGFPLAYHVGPHLIRAQALRWAGIHPYDSICRFDVTLAALALLLALRAAARVLGAGRLALALAPWAVLATDFSFLFGMRPDYRWWTEQFGGNLLVALFFANASIPALAIALAALVAFARQRAGEGGGWLALAALLAVALPFFKVFFAAPLVAGALVALLLGGPALPLIALAAPCLVAAGALALGPGGATVEVLLDPLAPVAHARQALALPLAEGRALLAWALPWLLVSLGLRVAALPEALRALRSRSPAIVILAVAALAGWPIALLVRISADRVFNESVYFTNLSGVLLWLFAALAFERLAWTGARRALGLAAAALLVLPTTAEFVIRKASSPPDLVPARVVEAMERLKQDSRPGDVVLMRPYSRYPPPPIVFAGRRVPYTLFMPYLRQFVPPARVRARAEAVRSFFRADTPEAARGIAAGLGARYLFLQGSQAMGLGARGALEPIFVEGDSALYRIERP